jgi:uncharacterized cupin superfamily protein
VEVFNLVDGELEAREPSHRRPGYHTRRRRLGPMLGARALGATVYELDPGERIWPYHWELGNEEWLLVLAGEPTLREADGERTLRPGDLVCFREGPGGAHQVRNDRAEVVRVAMLSTQRGPYVAFYPDSRKLAVGGVGTDVMVRAEPELDYWDGEP